MATKSASAPQHVPVFEIKLGFDAEQVSDLLTSAFEGGSNYWVASGRRVGFKGFLQDVPFFPNGEVYVTVNAEGGDGYAGKEFLLDTAAIKRALTEMACFYKKHFSDWHSGKWDNRTADVFLQLCLFDEVIFA